MKKSWESDAEKRANRINERNIKIEAAVPTRMCPSCKRGPILESRRWVVYGTPVRAICRSCWLTDKAQTSAAKIAHVPLDKPLIAAIKRSYVISPEAIRSARERVGLSQQDLAEECNWSRARQRTIETEQTVLSEGEVRELIAALLSSGAKVWDSDMERVGIHGAGPSALA